MEALLAKEKEYEALLKQVRADISKMKAERLAEIKKARQEAEKKAKAESESKKEAESKSESESESEAEEKPAPEKAEETIHPDVKELLHIDGRKKKRKVELYTKIKSNPKLLAQYEEHSAKNEAAMIAAHAPKKSEAPIAIPKKEFVAEHKELVKVLKEDKPKAVAQEAKKQAAELKTTLAKPIDKYTNAEIADMIRAHLAKKGKTAALSHLNKSALLAVYKQLMG
jgi:hypothetical protein